MKAVSKGSLAGCWVHLDAGSTGRLARQNLQIPGHANNRTLLSWLFDACLSVRDRITSSLPDAISVTPLPTKSNTPTAPHLHQVSHPRQPNGDILRAHELNVRKRKVHLIEIKY